MQKTRAFIVMSKDLFAHCMSKKGGIVRALRDDPNIEKRCPVCNTILFFVTTQEHGQEEESLYCPVCSGGVEQ